MSQYPGGSLTPQEASDICLNQCRAKCCQGQAILTLTGEEAADFTRRAESLGVAAVITNAPSGNKWVRFTDHAGDRCPMLDAKTWACRIYHHRPQRCRDFPDRPLPDCPISGYRQ